MLDASITSSAPESFDLAPCTATSALALAAAFAHQHGDGVATAAQLLGGSAAQGRWLRLVADLRHGRLTARQAERELRRLHRLLTLEDVGDPSRDESAHFAMIDPASEVVHEICLLAEALERVLADMAEVTARQARAGRLPARIVRSGPGGHGREVAPPRWHTSPATRVRAAVQRRPPAEALPVDLPIDPSRPEAA